MATGLLLCLFSVFIATTDQTEVSCIPMSRYRGQFLCYTCHGDCAVWPNYEFIYKTSECSGCNCSYCYIGKREGISPERTLKFFDIFWDVGPVQNNLILYLKPRKDLSTFRTIQLYGNQEYYNHLPLTSFSKRYFNVNYDTLHRNNKTLPRNGQIRLYYFTTHEYKVYHIYQHELTWYSPLRCNVSYHQWIYPNDSLLSVDCDDELPIPRRIIYNTDNPYFEMRNNSVYLKDLTTTGSFNFSITAMYTNLTESATVVNVSLKVGRIQILRLTAVKDSKYRYHFTCYTNSASEDLTYEWYWNKSQVFRGNSSTMRNGKSQGTIVFDGLNEKDSGNLTCRVKEVHYWATKIKPITMKYFPVVELNTTSHFIKNRNPVNVSCHLSPTNGPSKLFFKVNNKEINESTCAWCEVASLGNLTLENYTIKTDIIRCYSWPNSTALKDMNILPTKNEYTLTKVTLSKNATVSCYGVNEFGQGENKTLRISVAIGKKFCPPVIYKNITWPETTEDTTVNVPCSKDFSGTVSRFCSINVKWEEPDTSSCVKNSILEAKAKLHRTEIIGGNFESAVEQLANSTKGSMGAKDINESIASLDIVSRIANNRKEVTRKEVTGFVEVVNNLAGSNRKSAWEKLADENQLTPASILKRTEDFGNIAARKINKTIVIPTENLVLKFQKVDVEKDINFSVPIDNNKSAWARKEQVFIPSNILKDNFGANETVAMSAVIFRNMKDLLPKSKNTSGTVNSYIVTVSLGKRLLNLSENILLSFSHLSTGLEQSCNFWEFGKDPELVGDWSTRGCEVNTTNSTSTVCSCDHLTSFAILMKPEAMHMTKRNEKVLDIITKVGCSISIVALVVTIIMYGILWKYLTSQDVARSQSILLMNMCVPLIIAYLLFLTLVEETQEKIGCIVIAALIHYFLLVSFFTMLAEGVDMAITLTVVFTSRVPRLPWLLVLSWVGPAIIVGISLAITKETGFVDHKYCWLALENNVRWAFIAPVLIIILANIICVVLILKALLSSHRMIHESVKQRLRAGARAIGILTPLLGFTWMFGVFAGGERLVFEYIFTVVNSLQGLFIFLAYCVFNKQIRKHLCKRERRTSYTLARVIHNDDHSNTPRNSGTKVTEIRKHLCKRERRTSYTPARVIHNDAHSNTPRNSGTEVTELTNTSNKYSLNFDYLDKSSEA